MGFACVPPSLCACVLQPQSSENCLSTCAPLLLLLHACALQPRSYRYRHIGTAFQHAFCSCCAHSPSSLDFIENAFQPAFCSCCTHAPFSFDHIETAYQPALRSAPAAHMRPSAPIIRKPHIGFRRFLTRAGRPQSHHKRKQRISQSRTIHFRRAHAPLNRANTNVPASAARRSCPVLALLDRILARRRADSSHAPCARRARAPFSRAKPCAPLRPALRRSARPPHARALPIKSRAMLSERD